MDYSEDIINNLGHLAKNASYKLSSTSCEEKNNALLEIAKSIDQHRSLIKAENMADLKAAQDMDLAPPLMERLALNDRIIDEMINGITVIRNLPDPVGKLITSKILPNGLELKKVRVPLGVVAIIFESRPHVVADVAALCLKSGNAAILRGGKEADRSNRAIFSAIDAALNKIQFTPFAVQIVPSSDRRLVPLLCRLHEMIDVIIPRGGEELIKAVSDCATVPVIKHYKGVCHIYVHEDADQAMALDICHNAKVQKPSACNAVETILIDHTIAAEFLPKLSKRLRDASVRLRGDDLALSFCSDIEKATTDDWSTEYLDLIVSIKIVRTLNEAINHINHFGSHHSDAIITDDKAAKNRFIKEIDSAAVYVNASTRFTDGGVFGLGAEMGISTDKLHARGPMALEELCTYKWVGLGQGQIR